MATTVSREAYFETGLDVLADLGYGGLKLAEVCGRLGVTTLPPDTAGLAWITAQLLDALDSGRFAAVPG